MKELGAEIKPPKPGSQKRWDRGAPAALIKRGHPGKAGRSRDGHRAPPSALPRAGPLGARAPPPAELEHLLRGVEPQLLDFS